MLAWQERTLGWFGGDVDLISQWRPSCNSSTSYGVVASSSNLSKNSPRYCNISQRWVKRAFLSVDISLC